MSVSPEDVDPISQGDEAKDPNLALVNVNAALDYSVIWNITQSAKLRKAEREQAALDTAHQDLAIKIRSLIRERARDGLDYVEVACPPFVDMRVLRRMIGEVFGLSFVDPSFQDIDGVHKMLRVVWAGAPPANPLFYPKLDLSSVLA